MVEEQECYCENCKKVTTWESLKKKDTIPKLMFNYYMCKGCGKGIDKKTFRKRLKKFKKTKKMEDLK